MTTTTNNHGVPNPLTGGMGIAPYLLQHIAVGIKENDPATKITPTGFLKLAIENTPDMGIPDHERMRLNSSNGQYRDVKLWYYKRALPSSVSTSLDCVDGDVSDRAVYNLSATHVASRTILLSNSDLAQYTEDAIATVKLGKAPSPFMEEVFKQIMIQCNAIAGKINHDLAADVQWGVNKSGGPIVGTGSQAYKLLNINKNANAFDLTQGIPSLLADAQLNEFNGDVLIAGAGFMLSYEQFKQKSGTMNNGLNIANTDGYKFYKDFTAPSIWASTTTATPSGAYSAITPDMANTIGVFAPGTIGFVDLNTLVGFREQNLGVYQAFQIPLPVNNDNGEPTIMMFDVRMRFNSCPSDADDAGFTGGTRTVGEGWSIQISKQYGLFQAPADLYASGDRMSGSNGALRYCLSNADLPTL